MKGAIEMSIKELKQEWVGQIVIYNQKHYKVADVDESGMLLLTRSTLKTSMILAEKSNVEVIEKSLVIFGRKFVIKTAQDYERAMAILDGNDFVADMSDSYNRTFTEKHEIALQRADVERQFSKLIAEGVIA